jgi:hypothetical protein
MLMPRGLGLSCPPGQQPTNMYDGSTQCCGVPGTSCEEDPCSFCNSAGYLATQQQAQANAIAGDAGNASAMLAAIAGYPQNVQNDAIRCQTNPGLTFVDEMGITVTCPSPSHSDITTGGQPFSNYSVPQLAAMLAQGATPKTETPNNLVGVQVPAAAIQSITPAKGPAVTTGSGPAGTPGATTSGSPGGSGGSNGSSSNGSSSNSSTGTMDLSFLTDSSLINGVPNWMVGFGGLALLLILPNMLGGHR